MPVPSCAWPHLSATRATLVLCGADPIPTRTLPFLWHRIAFGRQLLEPIGFPWLLRGLPFGTWARRILHDEEHRRGFIDCSPGWSEADGVVGNLFAFLFEDGIGK